MHDGEVIHPLLLGFKNLNMPTKVVYLGINYSLFRLYNWWSSSRLETALSYKVLFYFYLKIQLNSIHINRNRPLSVTVLLMFINDLHYRWFSRTTVAMYTVKILYAESCAAITISISSTRISYKCEILIINNSCRNHV